MKRLTDGEKATIKWLISFVEKHDGYITNAFEYGKEEMLDKACEWLENNLADKTSVLCSGVISINFDNVLKEFRKSMEEEK